MITGMDIAPRVIDLALRTVTAFDRMRQAETTTLYNSAKEDFLSAWDRLSKDEYVTCLGAGGSRHAYRVFSRDWKKSCVLKLEIGDLSGSNDNERKVWDYVRDTEFSQHFAAVIEGYDVHPRILLQEYIPPTVYPGDNHKYHKQADALIIALKEIGVLVHDDRPDKNGAWHDKVIVFDYGNYSLM